MNKYYRILSRLSILLFITGCSDQWTYDELTSDIPSNLETRTYSSSKMNYTISLLNELALADKQYNDTLAIELFIDTTKVFEEGVSMLSVLKYNSTDTILEDAWNKLLSNRVLFENFRIHSEGNTNFLFAPAYYEHSSCTISNKNTESISFLFRGKSSDFYLLFIQAITEEGYPDNMKQLLFCAKSMKILQ